MIVDVSRRFRELTDEEIKAPESLMSLADAGLLKSIEWTEVLRHSRVVLLAEAGSGKTFEMMKRAKELSAQGKPAFFLPLEALDDGTISSLLDNAEESSFNSWRTDDQSIAWLFLDAVDELKLTQGRLERALRRVAKEIDGCLYRVRIVVSCRPTDWRPSLDLATMRRVLPSTPAAVAPVPSEETFLSALRKPESTKPAGDEEATTKRADDTCFVVLLPLDQPQIEAFAKALDVADIAGFVAELRRQDAWAFARRPFDLSELITTWKAQGRLGTRAEQHDANVIARLKDDPERPDHGVLTDAEVRIGAERLGLALSLTRTRTIRAPELSVDANYAEGVLDSASVLVDWSEQQRQSLLRRALFDPATYGRVRFHHRSIQEYLAARRLKELGDQGMPTKAVLRLLFAERYGIAVVIPSMRPIAAWLALWNGHVRRELMRREPETLLSMGDPESLPIAVRSELLRAFVGAYGNGGWRGLRIPIDEVRRLAHPELASLVLELWKLGSSNDDVRELLLDLIDQGAMQGCADVCEQTARATSLPDHHRYMAIRALLSCHQDPTVQAIARSIIGTPGDWPLSLVAEVVDELFPRFLSAAEVMGFVEMPAPERVLSSFGNSLRRIAATVEPSSQPATDLRDLLAIAILAGRQATDDGSEDNRFDHVAPALATLCLRQLEAGAGFGLPTYELLRGSAIASRFAVGATGGTEPVARLRRHYSTNEDLRSRTFWIELSLVDALDSSGDPWRRLRRTQRNGLLGDFLEADRGWLRRTATDQSDQSRRAIAVQALVLLWVQQGRIDEQTTSLLDLVRDDADLTNLVESWLRPPEEDPTIEGYNKRERARAAKAAAAEDKRIADWTAWRERLLAEPAESFTAAKQLETIANLYKWLSMRNPESDRRNAWDHEALRSAFGDDLATRAREAFQRLWRAEEPLARSRRPSEDRNSVFYSWIYGLCGIAAEAEAPGWATRLSASEAKKAATYALMEINGLPVWLKELTAAHPLPVEATVGEEVEAEIREAALEQHLPVLQGIAYGGDELKQLLAPRLHRHLATWPTSSGSAQADAALARHLEATFRILESGSEADAASIASVCEDRVRNSVGSAIWVVWLKGLFRFAPDKGVPVLQDVVTRLPAQERTAAATNALGELFGMRSGFGFDLSSLPRRAEVLGALVRFAYEFVRPADDQQHEAAYAPNARDEAERARDFLLSALLDTPGHEAQGVLNDLVSGPLFDQHPDRLRLMARERVAKDAEHGALPPADFVALERRYELPPNDRDGLFELMVDRVEDLAADVADHDFTDRRTLQTIVEEVEMQRTLALRIEATARGAYTVTREAEVADAKRTDIRLAAIRGSQKATIEVKIADKGWSVNELERALKEQLVGQYLRHDSCKAGCLLLTYSGEKKFWEHPQTGASMGFSEVVAHLDGLARTIEAEQGFAVRLKVYGLDLRNPS